MSQETREYLKDRYGMSGFGGMGYDLSRPDRLEAASTWLDTLFEDFTDWLMEQPNEATTADEVEPILFEMDADEAILVAEREPVEQPLKVESISWWLVGYEEGEQTAYAEGYKDLNLTITDQSIAIIFERKDGAVTITSLPRAQYCVSWTKR